jgi:ribosomal protein L16 Arg81 hydroxylase
MQLSKAINCDLHCSSDCNVYISPDQSQGFEAHYDTHDVFVLQVAGNKHWKIYRNPIALPLANQPSIAFDCSNEEPLYDIELEQGDMIYMPKGYVHEAMTTDGVSAHITVGVYNTTWVRILLDYITQLAAGDEALRAGFFVDDLRGNVDKVARLDVLKTKLLNDLSISRLEAIAVRYTQSNDTPFSLRPPVTETTSLG